MSCNVGAGQLSDRVPPYVYHITLQASMRISIRTHSGSPIPPLVRSIRGPRGVVSPAPPWPSPSHTASVHGSFSASRGACTAATGTPKAGPCPKPPLSTDDSVDSDYGM